MMLLEVFPFLHDTKFILQLLFSLMLAILFVQSGFNKVFEWEGNKNWINDHFRDTFLHAFSTILLIIITLTEIAAGVLSGVGAIALFVGTTEWAYIGAILSALNIVMLFLGQRVAKDYEGAANLVPYFILCALAIYVLGNWTA